MKRETHLSSWVMMTSWKFSCSLLVIMMLRNASAKLALFSASRLVVGSSSARIPQFKQKVSASASLMIRHASTCSKGHVNTSQDEVDLHLQCDGSNTLKCQNNRIYHQPALL